MIVSTRGIVFRTINFRETSVILKVYTELLGMRSYIVNGVRKINAKQKAALLRPLSLLHLEVYESPGKNIQRIKEYRPAELFTSLPFDIQKSSVGMFIGEVLHKSIKEEEENEELFEFLFNSISFLDKTESSCANFPLWFLLDLSRHLGFYPRNNFSEMRPHFDLVEGDFVEEDRQSYGKLDQVVSGKIAQLLDLNLSEFEKLPLSGRRRNELLQHLLKYYEQHVANFGSVKSLEVLREVLSA